MGLSRSGRTVAVDDHMRAGGDGRYWVFGVSDPRLCGQHPDHAAGLGELGPHARQGPPTQPEQAPDLRPPGGPLAPGTYANPACLHPRSIRFNTSIQQGIDDDPLHLRAFERLVPGQGLAQVGGRPDRHDRRTDAGRGRRAPHASRGVAHAVGMPGRVNHRAVRQPATAERGRPPGRDSRGERTTLCAEH